MRQQAIELALKVDPSLARELAQDSVELEERKRLWLMIAKNAASEGVIGGDVDVVSKVVSVLKDCGPDVLSIEDVRGMNSLHRCCWFRANPCEKKLLSLNRYRFFFPNIVLFPPHDRFYHSYQTLHKLIKSRMKFVKLSRPTRPKSKGF